MSKVPVQSVKKALDLLDILVFEDRDQAGRTLSALAEKMQLPPNSTHNLLKSMAACGYAAQNAAGAYVAGPKCTEMGRWNRLFDESTKGILEAELEQLGSRLNEMVVFNTLVHGDWISVARRDCAQPVRVAPTVSGSIYTVATCRVLTAYTTDMERDRVIERHGLPGRQWDGIRSRGALDAACAAIRQDGFCVIERSDEGTVMMARAVLSKPHEELFLQGALGCGAPAFRCPPERIAEILQELQASAERLAVKLP